MDPEATIQQIRALDQQIEDAETLAHENALRQEAYVLYQALDEWMSCGGFKPYSWGG